MCLYLLLLLCFCCHIQEVTARLWQIFASHPLALLPGPFLHCNSACFALHGDTTEKETLALEATCQRWQSFLCLNLWNACCTRTSPASSSPQPWAGYHSTVFPEQETSLYSAAVMYFEASCFYLLFMYLFIIFKLVTIMTCEFSIHDVVCTFSILILTLTYTILCTPLPVLKTHIACDMFPSQAILR